MTAETVRGWCSGRAGHSAVTLSLTTAWLNAPRSGAISPLSCRYSPPHGTAAATESFSRRTNERKNYGRQLLATVAHPAGLSAVLRMCTEGLGKEE